MPLRIILQVAGQVVATWGPRPGTRGDHTQHNHVPTDYQASAGFGSPLNDYHPYQPYGYHQHHNHHHQHQHKPPRKYYQDRKHGYNQSRQVCTEQWMYSISFMMSFSLDKRTGSYFIRGHIELRRFSSHKVAQVVVKYCLSTFCFVFVEQEQKSECEQLRAKTNQ